MVRQAFPDCEFSIWSLEQEELNHLEWLYESNVVVGEFLAPFEMN